MLYDILKKKERDGTLTPEERKKLNQLEQELQDKNNQEYQE